MNKNEFLEKVKKQVLYIFDHQDIVYELSEHIDDSARDMMEEGLSYDEALDIAIKQMGNPVEIGKELNKAHHPFIGYTFLISKIIIILNIIPIFLCVGMLGFDTINFVLPVSTRGGEVVVEIKETIELPTERFFIDKVCVKDDTYYLTYRSINNITYTRTTYGMRPFLIVDELGQSIERSSSSHGGWICDIGFREFEMPDDKILYLKFIDHQIITLDLTEYGYE